jgi:hypothetical protein
VRGQPSRRFPGISANRDRAEAAQPVDLVLAFDDKDRLPIDDVGQALAPVKQRFATAPILRLEPEFLVAVGQLLPLLV